MKHLILIVFQCSLMLGVSLADDDRFLELKSAEGKTVRANILRYDKDSDMVLIERDNRKEYTVSADVFCKADQKIIRNWGLLSEFLNESGLVVSAERISGKEDGKQETKRTEENAEETRWMSVAHYRISMENRTTHSLDNITLKIIPFLKWEAFHPDRDIDFKVKSGTPSMQTFDILTIDPKADKEIESRMWGYESVTLQKGSDFIRKDIIEFQGVWVRVYTQLPDGTDILVRDIMEPKGLWAEIEWDDATKTIDLNTYQIADEPTAP